MWFALLHHLRRVLARDQRRPVPTTMPLMRLLLGEVGVLVRRVGRWRVLTTAVTVAAVTLAVETALGESTPGPVIAAPWRSVIAVLSGVLAVVAWAVLHALLRHPDRREPSPGPR
ncbi:MAG TPA: hypothetical protein VG452_03010 [Egibacteraceae bacterium]|nr:hypothetical protein [Egibacteraceae bacterium]